MNNRVTSRIGFCKSLFKPIVEGAYEIVYTETNTGLCQAVSMFHL